MRVAYALAFCVWASHIAGARDILAVPQIVDADTVTTGAHKIRILGIDAPESDQVCLSEEGRAWNCGIEARDRLTGFSNNRPWTCRFEGLDRYQRHLASCTVNGEDVGRWLVRNGWALAFRRYADVYVADEEAARREKRGLWRGAFIAPWEWRQRGSTTEILGSVSVPTDAQRRLISPAPSAQALTSSCAIKGNLKGRECIYHVPGGKFYDRLDMSLGGSRRWFCSETEAQAAGCRKSRL
jgi:endonuclease YncB( thermonuclease family)